MSSSRDDFSIAFRSALLQRGAAQKFSLVSLIFLATIVFILDINNLNFIKPIRSIINDGVYRVSLVASAPSRFFSTSYRVCFKLDLFEKGKREIKN